VKKHEPQDWGYKMKRHEFTPEEEGTLERWHEEIWARACARLREREGR
jgi:hypothetical protein